MARRPLYEKNELYKRTVKDTQEERDLGYARLLDLGGRKRVEMFWGENTAMSDDGIFRLRVGKETVYLDAEQFRKFLRWV